jgi:molecular chaperone DnaK
MSIAVGIDLGTTNSVISYINNLNKPIIIPDKEGNKITPSVICFKDNEIIVGDEAKELQELGIYDVAVFFKRQMGDDTFSFFANSKEYTPTELSSIILKHMKNSAEFYLGTSIQKAVITVPAYFKEKEREATIEAGKKAGFDVLQIINEPTAAAIAYGINTNKNQKVLVYDLGGGTFDVTILEITNNEIKILNSEGDHQLGGKDWDDRIINYVSNQFEEEFGVDPLEDSESVADLLVRVEDAKKKLSKLEKTTISISYDGMKGRYELTKNLFEELTSDLMERTVFLTQESLKNINLSSNDIDEILLVGGSTRMPMVHSFIKDRFNKKPLIGVNVDESVSIGAAILAKELSENKENKKQSQIFLGSRKLSEVTNHTLGMIAISEDNKRYKNSFILKKNTKIPASFTREYNHMLSKTKENILEIFLTQGDSEIPNEVDYLDKYVVTNIPYQKGGIAKIDVTYSYDINGVVNVKASINNSILPIKKEKLDNDIPDRFMKEPEFELINSNLEEKTIYLVLDVSGSMWGEPLEKAKEAAKEFINKLDLDYNKIGIIVFNNHTRVLTKAINNKNTLFTTIDGIYSNGGTNANPFNNIYNLLANIDDKRYAVVLTDGQWFRQNEAIEKAQKCHQNGIEVVAIGFGGADKWFLNEISSSDEGSIFTSQEKLVESFSSIAQEINNGDL